MNEKKNGQKGTDKQRAIESHKIIEKEVISPMIIESGRGLPALSEESMEEIVEKAKRNVDLMRRMKLILLRATNVFDWVIEGREPYLLASGAQKIAIALELSIRNVTAEKEIVRDEKGIYYLITYKGEFTKKNGTSIIAIGVCSSRDKFFGTKKGIFKPIYEVKQENIKKKAFTNMLNNGIKSASGFKSVSFDELKEVGINLDSNRRVDYQKKNDYAPKNNNKERGSEFCTEKQSRYLYVKIREICELKGINFKDKLKEFKERLNVNDLRDLSRRLFDKEITIIEGSIKEYKEMREQEPTDPSVTDLTDNSLRDTPPDEEGLLWNNEG